MFCLIYFLFYYNDTQYHDITLYSQLEAGCVPGVSRHTILSRLILYANQLPVTTGFEPGIPELRGSLYLAY